MIGIVFNQNQAFNDKIYQRTDISFLSTYSQMPYYYLLADYKFYPQLCK